MNVLGYDLQDGVCCLDLYRVTLRTCSRLQRRENRWLLLLFRERNSNFIQQSKNHIILLHLQVFNASGLF